MDENNLSYEEFLDEFKDELSSQLSSHDLQFDETTVHKANEDLAGLVVRTDGSNISPTIYPESLYEAYQRGESIDTMAGRYAEIIENSPKEFDLSQISAEGARENITFSLVNTKENEEWLKGVPHEEIGDLSAIPRYQLGDGPDGRASFVVTNETAAHLQLTKEEVLDIARTNTENGEYTIQGMSEVMGEMMRGQGMPDEYIDEMIRSMGDQEAMYVITNPEKIDGSSAMLSDATMQEMADKLGEDFYILPSSRHEVLAVPESTVSDPEDLRQMVKEVNATEVSKGDYLSDNVYHYDAHSHELEPMFDENGRLMEHEDGMEGMDGKEGLDDGMDSGGRSGR